MKKMENGKGYVSNLNQGVQRVGRRLQGKPPGGIGWPVRFGAKYLKNLLVSLDQFLNTAAAGSPDETISSRLGRNYKGSFLYKAVNVLFFWQKGKHCDEAVEPESHSEDALLK